MVYLTDLVKIFAVLDIPLGFSLSSSPVMGRCCQLQSVFLLARGIFHAFDGYDSSR